MMMVDAQIHLCAWIAGIPATSAVVPGRVEQASEPADEPKSGRTSRKLIQIDLSMAFLQRASPYRQR